MVEESNQWMHHRKQRRQQTNYRIQIDCKQDEVKVCDMGCFSCKNHYGSSQNVQASSDASYDFLILVFFAVGPRMIQNDAGRHSFPRGRIITREQVTQASVDEGHRQNIIDHFINWYHGFLWQRQPRSICERKRKCDGAWYDNNKNSASSDSLYFLFVWVAGNKQSYLPLPQRYCKLDKIMRCRETANEQQLEKSLSLFQIFLFLFLRRLVLILYHLVRLWCRIGPTKEYTMGVNTAKTFAAYHRDSLLAWGMFLLLTSFFLMDCLFFLVLSSTFSWAISWHGDCPRLFVWYYLLCVLLDAVWSDIGFFFSHLIALPDPL